MANLRACIVSFTDREGLTHAVEVAAASLYEAAALALAEFRRCGFTDPQPSPTATLMIAVKAPATTHEVSVDKLRHWLNGGATSPKELVLKQRLKALIE